MGTNFSIKTPPNLYEALVFLLFYGSKVPTVNLDENKEHNFHSQTLQCKDTVQSPRPQNYINRL